ncbi:MAG: PAS domain S-box protein [Planctomycetes bacterium]|nr:PAS domain S-box protein [Planctomycetota bacterium]
MHDTPPPGPAPPGGADRRPDLRKGDGCERVAELYERSPVAHVLVTRAGLVVELNLAAAGLLELERQRAVGRPLLALAALERGPLLAHLRACSQDEAPHALELDLTTRAGVLRRVLVDGCSFPDIDQGEPLCLIALTDLSGRRRADEALEFVLEAAGATTGPLEPDAVIERVAASAVPFLADLCVVDLVHEGGLRRRVALFHADAERAARVVALEERWGVLPNVSFATLQALQTGRPQLLPPLSPAYMEAAAVDPEHFTALVGLVLRSWAVIPLTSPDAPVLGVLRLAMCGVRRPLSPQDVTLAARLGAFGGAALTGARARVATRGGR